MIGVRNGSVGGSMSSWYRHLGTGGSHHARTSYLLNVWLPFVSRIPLTCCFAFRLRLRAYL
jgi:hypothetical protein